jgi:hypothetical protein
MSSDADRIQRADRAVRCSVARTTWLDAVLAIPDGPTRKSEVWAMLVALSEAIPGDRQIEAALVWFAEAGKPGPVAYGHVSFGGEHPDEDLHADPPVTDRSRAMELDAVEDAFFKRKLHSPCMAIDRETMRSCVVDRDEHAGRDHEFSKEKP